MQEPDAHLRARLQAFSLGHGHHVGGGRFPIQGRHSLLHGAARLGEADHERGPRYTLVERFDVEPFPDFSAK